MTTVLLVDNEALTRAILRDYLSSDPNITVLGEAADGRVAVQQALALRPDVILMDMHMPVMDGVAATAAILASQPDIAILGLTTFATDRFVVDFLRAGAAGYLLKDTNAQAIIDAVHQVAAGEPVLSPEVTCYVFRGLESSVPALTEPDPTLMAQLTERELEAIRLLAQGMSNREIAEALFVTESTIKARFVKVMEKLGVRDRVQILVTAISHGLVTVPDSCEPHSGPPSLR